MVCTSRKISESVSCVVRRALQLHQRDVEVGEALVGLGQEIGEQIVHGGTLARPGSRAEAHPGPELTKKR